MSIHGPVAVIGLGLIGGSVARDLARAGVTVVGYDSDPSSLRAAVVADVVKIALASPVEAVNHARVVVLAVPLAKTRDMLVALAPEAAELDLVTDVGSVKASIVAAASECGLGRCFVGGHAMAGHHRSGWAASRAGLFSGATVYLCPAPQVESTAVELAHVLWQTMGAVPRIMHAAAHDTLVAWSSHMPQVTSTAVALALAERGVAVSELGPGGRGVTRLAASSVEMWSAVLRDNAREVIPALAALELELGRLRETLLTRDQEGLEHMLIRSRDWSLSR